MRLLEAFLALALTAIALKMVGLRRWQAVLARRRPAGRPLPGSDEATLVREGLAAARLVEAAARQGPYRATCLQRSLALWWLLRRRRIDSELRIGVRKEGGRLEAHAWVELRGLVLNEVKDVRERFAAFDRAILAAGGTIL
jgi:hypothetical protein